MKPVGAPTWPTEVAGGVRRRVVEIKGEEEKEGEEQGVGGGAEQAGRSKQSRGWEEQGRSRVR